MFSIPIALLVLDITTNRRKEHPYRYYLAGLMSAFVPNPAVSITLFIINSAFADNFKKVMPFAGLLAIKLIGVPIKSFPIWREQQMQGHFCSQITSLFEDYGLLSIVFIFSLLHYTSLSLIHRDFTFAAAWVYTFFIRVGNDVTNNVLAQQACILPLLCGILSDWYHSVTNSYYTSILRKSLFKIYIVSFILGGIICGIRISSCHIDAYDLYSLDASKWIRTQLSAHELVLTEPNMFNPVSLAGRQIICGNYTSVWKRGGNITNVVPILREAESGGWISLAEKLKVHWVVIPSTTKYSTEGLEVFSENSHWRLLLNKYS